MQEDLVIPARRPGPGTASLQQRPCQAAHSLQRPPAGFAALQHKPPGPQLWPPELCTAAWQTAGWQNWLQLRVEGWASGLGPEGLGRLMVRPGAVIGQGC